jgi:site-specific DNA-methyltransferase (adenine-specific)
MVSKVSRIERKDINPTNIYICKLLLDPENKLNYNEGNTLELDLNKKWKLSGFDAVIGNPPYSTDPSKPNSKPLYNLFIDEFIDKTNYLLFVVPSRWFVGGKGLDKFREKMLKRKDIKLIVHNDNDKEWFGNNIEIKGGCNYFLKEKGYEGMCKFNGIDYKLSKYDSIIKPKYHNVIDKLIMFDSINKLYKGRYFGIETNDKKLKDIGKIKCYISSLKQKDRIKYLDKYNFTDENKFWKVITSRAAFGSGSGFGYKTIAKPDEIHTGSYISFKVNDEKEAKSLLSYLECKLPNYMLSIRKISQDINENVCKWIPLVPLDRIWDDSRVFEYFKIKESELV